MKQAAAFLVSRLSGEANVAVVDYDSQAALRCPLLPAGDDAVVAAIAGIEPGGTTNLSAGWLKGPRALAAVDGVRRVLLLTDGLANEGITDPATLADVVRGAASDGMGTTSVGVGDGFNEDLLAALARAAGGLQIQLGDAYAGYPMRLVARLHAPSLAVLGPVKLADLVLRYVAVGDEIAQHEVTLPIVANIVNADEAAAALPDAEVIEHVVILTAAKAAEEATRLADEGRFEEARRHLDQAVSTLRATAPASAQAEALLAQAAELRRSSEVMAAPMMFDATERKRLHRDAHRRSTGRRPRSS